MVQIFISYNRDDRPFVDQLLPLIRKVYGKDSVWFDEDIHGGAEWWELILKEIGRSTLFIYLISNESLESAYCQAEMREALRLGIPILPIIIRRLKPPYPGRIEPELAEILSKLHYIDISAGIKNKLEKIAEMYAALHQLLTQETRSTPPPIATLPTPKPVVLTPKAKLPDVYVTGLFGVLIAVIAGVFGLWQGWFTQQSPLPTATPTTAIALAVTSSMTPTLTGFQELQTVQAVQSAQAETEVALGLTQTEARIS
ncbi:MAG: toll/interleukin-1 receptor domain-containing protein, partial [Anaerolineae bacterium]|nr:toll/interleukin-1 receptor domain-containing protein [Anaerolineae bacterium]